MTETLRAVRDEAALRHDIMALRGLAVAAGARDAADALDDIVQRLDAQTLTVLVLGEFNRGKSALINSLLGEPLLPMGTTPTTRVVTEVRHGPAERIEFQYDDGVSQPIDREAYRLLAAAMARDDGPDDEAAGDASGGHGQRKIAATIDDGDARTLRTGADRHQEGATVASRMRDGGGGAAALTLQTPPSGDDNGDAAGMMGGRLRRVVVTLPAAVLERLTLVDTPGLNDPDNVQADLVYDLLPRCDVGLFVLDSSFALSLSERAIIGDKLLRGSLGRLIFVLNKADQLDDAIEADDPAVAPGALADARPADEQVSRRAIRLLEPLLGGPPVVLPYSARAALRGEPRAGNDALRRLLTEELPAQRRSIMQESARGKAAAVATTVAAALRLEQNRLAATTDELARELADLEAREADRRGQVAAALDALMARLAAVREDYLTGLRALANTLGATLPGEVRGVDPADVRRHLPFYIQDTFRWHLEETLPALRAAVEAACAAAEEDLSGPLSELSGGFAGPAQAGAYPLGRRTIADLWDHGLVLRIFASAIGLFVSPLLTAALLVGGPALRLFTLQARYVKEREELVAEATRAVTSTADAMAASISDGFARLETDLKTSVERVLSAQVDEARAALRDARTRREAGADNIAERVRAITTSLAEVADTQARLASDNLAGAVGNNGTPVASSAS